MRKHIAPVTTIKLEGSTVNMSLTNFVDQMDAPSSSFSSLEDFSAGVTADALKWIDLEQNVVYQIVNTRTVNRQHSQSVILSLQKADGSNCNAWAGGMLYVELKFIVFLIDSAERGESGGKVC